MKDTLTFGLDGEVALEEFTTAITNLNSLLNQLSKEVVNIKVDWVIDELFAGSAVATFCGVYEDMTLVEQVVDAYETVGESLQLGNEIPFSSIVKRYAINLTKILNGRITAIRFETPAKDFVVSGKSHGGDRVAPMKYSLGTIKGTIQTLSMRKKLSFTIWDTLFDKPVSCYLKEGDEERMRYAWGKRAVVSGRIGRQSESGRPVVIREVKDIRFVEEPEPASYKRAKGALPWVQGDEPAQETIRRLRNA